MPGARRARSLACDKNKAHERSHHGHTGNRPAFPAQWFYDLYRALPGDRAFLPPSPAKVTFRELDTSVGVSGPHDFSVHKKALSSLALLASTASRPASVTIANRPSVGRDHIEIFLFLSSRQA